jgi:hypothetical protein
MFGILRENYESNRIFDYNLYACFLKPRKGNQDNGKRKRFLQNFILDFSQAWLYTA